MRNRIKRKDDNQRAIIQVFEGSGCSVLDISQVSDACDLVVGFPIGANVLCEIKNMDGAGDKLTPGESRFWSRWVGPLVLLRTEDDARDLIQRVAGGDGETLH